ncbi:bifunctional metallophosphatase/5'-nucleotidase [Novosphingobium sp. 9]|uniref:bifunctional metallophosphatase/5'-nucleotidase n=1 Tax=Novosphingobium sp. 9 TaxID=2025349 RepID=UPI0021B6CFE5|nr:bifunctional metallophosphatase/5'-nucleotidase [Novosphingobium sp. 9]
MKSRLRPVSASAPTFTALAPALLSTALVALLAGCATPPRSAAPAPAEAKADSSPVTVGILAFNDFHGNIEAPHQAVMAPDGKGGTMAVPAGGAAWLGATLEHLRKDYTYSLTVAAGDIISASPLSSALFVDEPTIGVMNRIGLDITSIGNHEFDRGIKELHRDQFGGCEKNTLRQPCQLEQFGGAKFEYLAANAVMPDGSTLFPATAIRSFGEGARKVTIGFIGLTLKDTADLVSSQGLQGLRFVDEASTINALVPKLKAQGADAVVVLIHQGGAQSGKEHDPSACAGFDGAIEPILAKLDPRVDLVVSGHTHQDYVCNSGAIDPQHPVLLTSAGLYGKEVTDITLKIDPVTHKVVGKSAHNVIVQSPAYQGKDGLVANTDHYPQLAPDQQVAAYVERYAAAARTQAQRPVGHLAGMVSSPDSGIAGGGTLGSLIADAQLDATRSAGAQIAFTNAFGIRAPHMLAPAKDGSLTYQQIYAVQPFGNVLVTKSLTGAEIKTLLEEGYDDDQPHQSLVPSHGFAYSFDLSKPIGARVVKITLDGKPLDPAKTYRVTTNTFLSNGGDSFGELAKISGGTIGMNDLDALEAWLAAVPMRAVPTETRVTQIGTGK